MSTSRTPSSGDDEGDSMSGRIVAAARDLAREPDPQATLALAVSVAVDLVGHAAHASITLIHPGRRQRLETPASTSGVGVLLDELQYELGEGPCLDAVHGSEVIRSPDVATDPRWPVWGPRAAERTAVRSMLCLRLFTHSNLIGAINLQAEDGDAFDDGDVQDGLAVAAHVALAVSSAVKIENLHTALDSRTLTGQATGVVMGQYDLDAAAAFGVLARISSHTNRRLRDVAREVVETRRLPEY